jgi:hypothetical protein
MSPARRQKLDRLLQTVGKSTFARYESEFRLLSDQVITKAELNKHFRQLPFATT